MKHSMTTTALTLEGHRIVKSLGVVRGIIVRSRSALGNNFAKLQMAFGGNITVYTRLCEQAREEAFVAMVSSAIDKGANAIIGIRYDATEIMPGVTEVLCYGTAVIADTDAPLPDPTAPHYP